MTNMDLLQGFGGAKASYVLEAQRFRSGGKSAAQPQKKPSIRRMWLLIAAIIAAMALAIPAYAAIQRIQLRLTQKAEPQPQEEEILLTYYPQSLPEGYSLIGGSQTNPQSRSLLYENGEGQTIGFFITTGPYQNDLRMRPPVEEETLDISGSSGTLRTAEAGGQHLFWKNEAVGYWASLFTEDIGADLAAMARSVAPGEPIPFSVHYQKGEEWESWYSHWVPEGYTLTDVSPLSADGNQHLRFTKPDSPWIEFYISATQNFLDMVSFDPPPGDHGEISLTWEDVRIGEDPGKLERIRDDQQFLFWSNEKEGFHAMLTVNDGQTDLIPIAESVGPGKKLEASPQYLGPDFKIDLTQEDTAFVEYEPMYPQAIPEGYEMTFVSDRFYGDQSIRYENSAGETLSFTLYWRLYGRDFAGMGEPPETVEIHGHTGYRMAGGGQQSILWTDEERGFGFKLSGPAELDLLAVAQSVAPGPELTPTHADWTEKALKDLGDYRITALPEGMEEDAMVGAPLEEGGGWYAYVNRRYCQKAKNWEVVLSYDTIIPDGDNPALGLVTGGRDGLAQEVMVNGCLGAASQTDDQAELAWVLKDGQQEVAFTLMSEHYTVEELLEFARSVKRN